MSNTVHVLSAHPIFVQNLEFFREITNLRGPTVRHDLENSEFRIFGTNSHNFHLCIYIYVVKDTLEYMQFTNFDP